MKNSYLFRIDKKVIVPGLLLLLIIPFTAMGQVYPHHKLAPTPPMGWNSWNCFFTDINEEKIMQIADLMVSKGFKDSGYQYVNLDDGWEGRRDKNGNIMADSVKFPHGMKYLADYVHSKGLKFGLYTSPGKTTCAGYPGSLGHEQQDVETYASWGVDYIKWDYCSAGTGTIEEQLTLWRSALDKAKRPIVFGVGINRETYNYGSKYANLWRTSVDLIPSWDLPIEEKAGYRVSVVGVLDQQPGLERYQSPGAWNDPDMLQVGVPPLSYAENKSHFSMWAILGAPLLMGNDLREMTPEINEILINKEIIAINQDPLGYQGRKISDSGKDISKLKRKYGMEVWVKKLSAPGEFAVALLNRSEYTNRIRVSWKDIGLDSRSVQVRDLWKHEDLGSINDSYSAEVPPHDVVVLKVKGIQAGDIKEFPSVMKDSIVAEAEQGSLNRAHKVSEYGLIASGYSGAGYVQFEGEISDRFIRFVVNVPSEGFYLVGVRYANFLDHPVKMIINCDNKDNFIDCPDVVPTKDGWPTGTIWSNSYIKMKLKKGYNVIKINSGDVWGPFIDYLVVKPG